VDIGNDVGSILFPRFGHGPAHDRAGWDGAQGSKAIHPSIARLEGRSGKTKTVAPPALCRVPVPSRKFFKASRRAPTSPGRFCVPHHTDNTLDGEINP
jgi:hypothetical protein